MIKNNKIKTINKIINIITLNGKKIKSEQIILKSIKELQKHFSKKTQTIVQLSLILSSPIFKLYEIKQKKRKKKPNKIIPTFIVKQNSRISFAIKLIIYEAKKNKALNIHKGLKEKILETNKYEKSLINTKKNFQKKILINKHLFKYYKWN